MLKTEPTMDELEEYVRVTAEHLKGKDFMEGFNPNWPFTVVMREIPPYKDHPDGSPNQCFLGQEVDGVFKVGAFLDFARHQLVVSPARVKECYEENPGTGWGSLSEYVWANSSWFLGFA